MAFIQRAESAHVAVGDSEKQRRVARAAVHILTVAPPGRKSFTPRRKFPDLPAPGVASAQASSLHVFAYYLPRVDLSGPRPVLIYSFLARRQGAG